MEKRETSHEKNDFCFKLAETGTTSYGPAVYSAGQCLLIFGRCLLIAMSVFIVSAIIMPPRYDSVDDVHLTMIVSGVGVCDQPDPHMVFAHIFLGQALAWLYKQADNIPWYGLTLAFANVFSLALILSVFMWERSTPARRALLLILYFFSLLSLWTNLQFTSTAIFLASAASLVILSTLEIRTLSSSGRTIVLLLATLAMVLAALLRIDGALLMIVLLAGLIFCRFFHLRSQSKEKRFGGSKVVVGLLICAFLFCLVEGLNFINFAHYTQEPKWDAFQKMRPPVIAIFDFERLAHTAQTKRLFDAVNWTKNDLEIFHACYFPIDPAHFSIEKCNWLVSQCPPMRSDLSPTMVLKQVGTFFCNPFVLPGLILACLLTPLLNTSIVSRGRQLSYIMFLLALLAYVISCMKLVQRITIPISAWALLVSLYYCDSSKLKSMRSFVSAYLSFLPLNSFIPRKQIYSRSRKIAFLVVSILAISVTSILSCYNQRISEKTIVAEKFKKSLTAVEKLNGKLYVAPSYIPVDTIGPFENPRDYFGTMPILIPAIAAAPLREIEKRVIKNTHIPFFEEGVYAFSTDWCNDRIKEFYWDHHRLPVSFRPCYTDKLVGVYKGQIENPEEQK